MVTPAKAWSMTLRETPAAVASRPMADRKVLKSPPHCAAWTGAASRTLRRTKANSLVMDGPVLPPSDLYTVIAGLVPSAVMPGLSRLKGRRALHAYVSGIRLRWEDDEARPSPAEGCLIQRWRRVLRPAGGTSLAMRWIAFAHPHAKAKMLIESITTGAT